MEPKNQFMILDSAGQSYGPFMSYDLAERCLINKGWELLDIPQFCFTHVIIGAQSSPYLYAKIVTLKEIATIDRIPSKLSSPKS